MGFSRLFTSGGYSKFAFFEKAAAKVLKIIFVAHLMSLDKINYESRSGTGSIVRQYGKRHSANY
jgi:hypothetical protein